MSELTEFHYAWGAAAGCFIWRRARWPAVHLQSRLVAVHAHSSQAAL